MLLNISYTSLYLLYYFTTPTQANFTSLQDLISSHILNVENDQLYNQLDSFRSASTRYRLSAEIHSIAVMRARLTGTIKMVIRTIEQQLIQKAVGWLAVMEKELFNPLILL